MAISSDVWVHRIPHARVVDRQAKLAELCRGRRVVHIGFVDRGLMEDKRSGGTWLHARLAQEARELVGIDLDEAGVMRAGELGYAAHAADCQREGGLAELRLAPSEVVVAGELIEHLDRPGVFLEEAKAIVAPDGLLVLTTPNPLRLVNFLGALVRREVVSPEHVGWHSWHTLHTLLANNGWDLTELNYYCAPPPAGRSPKVLGVRAVRALSRGVSRVAPPLADGIVAVARRSASDG